MMRLLTQSWTPLASHFNSFRLIGNLIAFLWSLGPQEAWRSSFRCSLPWHPGYLPAYGITVLEILWNSEKPFKALRRKWKTGILLSIFHSSGVFIGPLCSWETLGLRNGQVIPLLKHPLTTILQAAIG